MHLKAVLQYRICKGYSSRSFILTKHHVIEIKMSKYFPIIINNNNYYNIAYIIIIIIYNILYIITLYAHLPFGQKSDT